VEGDVEKEDENEIFEVETTKVLKKRLKMEIEVKITTTTTTS
jgi:hypothetical protein